MMNSDGPNAAGRELGAALRALREGSPFPTVRTLARVIDVSPGMISFYENATRLIPESRLDVLLQECGLRPDDPEYERLHSLRRLASDTSGRLDLSSPARRALVRTLVEQESVAVEIVNVETMLIPGLLQTFEYARSVLAEHPDADERARTRVGRAEILRRRHDPVRLQAFIDSEALVRPIAPPDAMRRQLWHLLDMAKLPNVSIRVLSGIQPGYWPNLDGSFLLIKFRTASPVVHLEQRRASIELWDPENVTGYVNDVDILAGVALSREDSGELIAKIAEETGEHR